MGLKLPVKSFLKSQSRSIDVETVYNYLAKLESAYILNRCSRQDLQGREILKTQEKFYLADNAFKHAVLGYKHDDISQTLENIVYLELRRRGYDVYVATATHHTNFNWKIDWFMKNFPFIDEKRIICIHNKSLLHVDVLVDDCAENLISTNPLVDRVLLDRPWNQGIHDDAYGIYRVHNWEEIVEQVDAIYKDNQYNA